MFSGNVHHAVRGMLLSEYRRLATLGVKRRGRFTMLVVAERHCLRTIRAKFLGQPKKSGQQGQAGLCRPMHTCCWWNQA